jgi:Fe-Mn family superoxide dismutase
MNSVLDLRNAVEPPHNDTRASAKFTLPSLPYPSNALADHGMSQETLELHHGKHHQAYVTALNGLVEKNDALKGKSLEELIKLSNGNSALQPVFNNAGQHWNHSTFWLSLSPQGGRIPGALDKKLKEDFGRVENFKETFKAAAVGQFGSGWVWLVLDRGGRLQVVKTGNAGTPIATGEGKVLLVLDVWEHAYYVDFRNRRPDFTDNFLNQLANYEYAAAELGKA